ncbi:response regulator [Paenibacillus swuensis]|uniref:response regulator n=1 Tax=Paenibacillus swuensis TaxID=1178515 RepID=UPI000839A5F0|nr:response regulator transcription factor [Paenibacillus swuensis]
MYKVLIADDQAIIRQGLRILLRGCPEFQVIGEASDGDEALERSLSLQPELVLTDLKMPGISVIEGAKQLKSVYPGIKVIILTALDESEDVYKAMRAGVDGYLMKDTEPEVIISVLRKVMTGEHVFRSSQE